MFTENNLITTSDRRNHERPGRIPHCSNFQEMFLPEPLVSLSTGEHVESENQTQEV